MIPETRQAEDRDEITITIPLDGETARKIRALTEEDKREVARRILARLFTAPVSGETRE